MNTYLRKLLQLWKFTMNRISGALVVNVCETRYRTNQVYQYGQMIEPESTEIRRKIYGDEEIKPR